MRDVPEHYVWQIGVNAYFLFFTAHRYCVIQAFGWSKGSAKHSIWAQGEAMIWLRGKRKALYPFQRYNGKFREGEELARWMRAGELRFGNGWTLSLKGINIRLKIESSVASRINRSMRWRTRQQKDFGKRSLLEGCSTEVNSKKKSRPD